MAGLLTLDDALRSVLERVTPLGAETVPVVEAAGRVLAEDAVARVDLPPFPSSAMDGFAVRAADTPGTLPVVAEIAAGRPAERPLARGEAMAIATGGVVPEGADAVVPIEVVAVQDNILAVGDTVVAGANIRPRGGDLVAGDVVLRAGAQVGAAQVGALAAAGLGEVRCGTRPRVAILTTGTELRAAGAELRAGEVYEANGPLLRAVLVSTAGDIEALAPVADDEGAHREAIERGLAADVFVSSGGVSVGPHDLVRRVGADLGVEEVFWGVAVKPGKPLSFGVHGRTLVFGLPGNPVSTLVGALLFVVPAALALQGAADPGPHYEVGRLGSSLDRNAARDELVRARARPTDEGVVLEPITGQESHMIARAATADVLVLIGRGEGAVSAGTPTRYLRLP